jgi:hypothetical protein
MTRQSLQLSTLTLADFPTTSLKTQFWSRLEPRTLFLLVADIYRRISLLTTKIQTYVTNDKKLLKIDEYTLNGENTTTANIGLAKARARLAFLLSHLLAILVSA